MIDIVRRGGQWQRNVIHGENELNAAAGGGRETTIRFSMMKTMVMKILIKMMTMLMMTKILNRCV